MLYEQQQTISVQLDVHKWNCSAHEYCTTFVQWHEQQLNNNDDFYLSVTEQDGKVCYTGMDLLLILILY